jgi:hypothetical protein
MSDQGSVVVSVTSCHSTELERGWGSVVGVATGHHRMRLRGEWDGSEMHGAGHAIFVGVKGVMSGGGNVSRMVAGWLGKNIKCIVSHRCISVLLSVRVFNLPRRGGGGRPFQIIKHRNIVGEEGRHSG